MNNENNQQIDRKEGVTVSSIVPAGWKLWALLFRAIAEGHLDELNQQIAENVKDYLGEEWFLDASFSDAVWGLYVETCKNTSRELPIEIYNVVSVQDALSELGDVAKDILECYQNALPCIDEGMDEAKKFEKVAENCRIVIQLLDYKPDKPMNPWDDEFESGWYFNSLDTRPWYKIVNGVCFEQMAYDDFYHVLECSEVYNWIEYADDDDQEGVIHERDYRNIKLSPHPDYGMAIFAFLLLLLSQRHLHEYPIWEMDEDGEGIITGVDCDEKTKWADCFKNRIDWGEEYYPREDSWKEGYLCSDEKPSSIYPKRSDDEKELLRSLCSRPTFEEVVGAEALDNVIAGNLSTEPEFDQYRFLYDKRDQLGKLYPLLVRELEYMYRNFDDIVDCFFDAKNAEKSKNVFSKWRFESKKINGKAIEDIYAGLREANVDDLHRLFFERCQFAYEYLWQQPLVHSGMVRHYLQDCIVQDEKLLTVIKRGLDDTPLKQAIIKEMARETGKQDRVEKAKAELRAQGIIDEYDNIRIINKKSKLIDLVRVLISRREDDKKEYARPVRGWGSFIKDQKSDNKISRSIPLSWFDKNHVFVTLIGSDNNFTKAFYSSLAEKGNNFARVFLNGIDWSLYDDEFRLDGELLKGEDLKKAIGSRRDLYVDIIRDIIKKYEMMDDSYTRITRK